MPSYQTNDGAVIEGENPLDFVREFRKLAPEQEESLHAFMVAVAARVLMQNGSQVETDTPANFLAGLIQSGLLTEVPE